MNELQEQFIAELNPLLAQSEVVIKSGDKDLQLHLAFLQLELIGKYAALGLTRAQIREAAENPTAKAIAHRLGWRTPSDPR